MAAVLVRHLGVRPTLAVLRGLGRPRSTARAAADATLLGGSPGPLGTAACSCAVDHDWCSSRCSREFSCVPANSGCGAFWVYPCDGLCVG